MAWTESTILGSLLLPLTVTYGFCFARADWGARLSLQSLSLAALILALSAALALNANARKDETARVALRHGP